MQRRSTLIAEFGAGGIAVAAEDASGTKHGRIEIAMPRNGRSGRSRFAGKRSRANSVRPILSNAQAALKTSLASSFGAFRERWSRRRPRYNSRPGEMAEWSKAPDSKSGLGQPNGGSNPSLSAIKIIITSCFCVINGQQNNLYFSFYPAFYPLRCGYVFARQG